MTTRGALIEGAKHPLPADPYDVVVIGAGVYGLCVGYELRRLRPDARVLVVEDNTIPGEGITVNTGGIVRSCYSNRDVAVASSFGQPYFADPTSTMQLRDPVHTGFVPSGWSRVVNESETPGIASELQRIVATADELGIPGVWSATREEWLARLDAGRAENVRRLLDLDDITHVLVDEHGGYADGGTTLLAFLAACLEHGVDVVTQCTIRGFVRTAGEVEGVRYERWSRGGADAGDDGRRIVSEGEVACDTVVVAAGAGSRRLLEQECGLRMPTLPTYHQTPMVENTSSVGFTETAYARTARDGSGAPRTFEVHTVDVPVISHWRDLYFHAEGSGITVGAHHRELHDEDYVPRGGMIGDGPDGIEVGLSQVLVDKILENLDYFPALGGDGLRLGRRPTDVPGGFYVMNPEELPFEGPVPGTNDRVHYIGSGSGTGFKLGPGLAHLLAQRLTGVPREERLVPGDTLSVERNRYFYPLATTESELRQLFDPASGRFRHMGASGIVAS
ncbi:MAG: FAD-binding oxidoreductase [Gemmatimonadota bacterium]